MRRPWDFSILFSGVHVAKNAVVDSSILMPGAVVEEGAEVHFAIVAENAVIRRGAYVGERPELMADKDQWGVTVIGAGVTVGARGHCTRPRHGRRRCRGGAVTWPITK